MVNKEVKHLIDNWQSFQLTKENIISSNTEYVSFDIFDTLLKRDVPNPIDVFDIVETISGIEGFKQNRIKAELDARKKNECGEVNLDDIYNEYQGTQVDFLKKTEVECEINVSIVNKELIELYETCVKHKKVILISDMYLPRSVIEELLKKNGITGYTKLFISNEVKKSKADGSLFEFVCQTLHIEFHNLLHIGNSFKADYLQPRKHKIQSFKIATYKNRLQRKYTDLLCEKNRKKEFLNSFINNHTETGDEYFKFGYECFGPLLYGFINWLFDDMKKNGIEQVFFLARDGYIMQKVYKELGFSSTIPDLYFEASRRSLRIPVYNKKMTYEDMLKELTVPNKTNICQLIDSLGLELEDYTEILKRYNISLDEPIKRDDLKDNSKFRKFYEFVHEDIIKNAERENILLDKYLEQFNFLKKTAIVDIGWGGSMQKYLMTTLKQIGIQPDIIGYYVGLTEKSKDNLGKRNYIAKGYAFDALNNANDSDMERPFVGLFETLFLEQNGSVKKYIKLESKVCAQRYPYEYSDGNNLRKEAIYVGRIQEGAIQFVIDFKKSKCAEYIGYDSNIFFSNLYQVGINPNLDDITRFGKFEFFNNGSKVYLANPKKIRKYVIAPKQLIKDLFDSQWKIGFLKSLLKIKLPYLKIFALLRKASN